MAKVNFKGLRILKDNMQKKAIKDLKDIVIEVIRENISKGVSPVRGQKRFVAYSDSYKMQIKKKRKPFNTIRKRIGRVNMTVTGEMLQSLKSLPLSKKLKIFFSDKKAIYHNELGAGKSKVIRRLLPTSKGEVFNKSITNRIIERVKKLLDDETK